MILDLLESNIFRIKICHNCNYGTTLIGLSSIDTSLLLEIYDGSAYAGRPHLQDETYSHEASFIIYFSVDMWYNFTLNYK